MSEDTLTATGAETITEETTKDVASETTNQAQTTTQSTPHDWIPEALRSEKSLHKFTDGDSVMKSYVELNKLLGTAVQVPQADASEETMNEFYNKLGRPETVDGYDITEKVPEGMPYDMDRQKSFLEFVHSNGASNALANKLIKFDIESAQKFDEQNTARFLQVQKESMQTLRDTWGATTDRNMALAERAAVEMGIPELDTLLSTDIPGVGKLGNLAPIVHLFSKIGKIYVEDGYIDGVNVGVGVDDAKAKIADIQNDKAHPYNNPQHADHDDAVKKLNGLYQLAYEK